MNCINCGNEIEEARRKASKGMAKTCIKCMNEKDVGRVAGFPIISGKTTYTELQLMSQDLANEMFHKQERKGQGPGNGVRMRGH